MRVATSLEGWEGILGSIEFRTSAALDLKGYWLVFVNTSGIYTENSLSDETLAHQHRLLRNFPGIR